MSVSIELAAADCSVALLKARVQDSKWLNLLLVTPAKVCNVPCAGGASQCFASYFAEAHIALVSARVAVCAACILLIGSLCAWP